MVDSGIPFHREAVSAPGSVLDTSFLIKDLGWVRTRQDKEGNRLENVCSQWFAFRKDISLTVNYKFKCLFKCLPQKFTCNDAVI